MVDRSSPATKLLLFFAVLLSVTLPACETAPVDPSSGGQTPATSPTVTPTGPATPLGPPYHFDLKGTGLAEDALELLHLVPAKNTIRVTEGQEAEIALFLISKVYRHWIHDQKIRTTGPFINGSGFGTHQRVRVYYSNGVVKWLENGRQGAIEDGSMIVKEMFYPDPGPDVKDPDKVNGWAVMVRDSTSEFDGWLWYLLFLPGDATYQHDRKSYFPGSVFSMYGMSFCISCHAATDTDQSTFAYVGNILGIDATDYSYVADLLAPPASAAKELSHPIVEVDENPDLSKLPRNMPTRHDLSKWNLEAFFSKTVRQPLDHPNPAIAELFGKPVPRGKDLVRQVGDILNDHVGSAPGGPDSFIASSSCQGCHDASYLQASRLPNMAVVDDQEKRYNLSMYAEWSASLMGLSSQDPVFRAQLESEIALRPEYSEYVQDFCLSCHAAMGQRQFHLDKENEAGSYYTLETLAAKPKDADGKYGALGRDGVSCDVCHRIEPENLGTPASFTARFVVAPPDTVYGPFEDPKTFMMERALGITPQHGSQIADSKLCGSCHTVEPPAIPLAANGGTEPHRDPRSFKKSHEQTTYMEWLNSRYNDEDGKTETSQSCAECHFSNQLPRTIKNVVSPTKGLDPLEFRIANIENGDFPPVPGRAESEELALEPRPYRRHSITGVNLFTMFMFQEFPYLLGYGNVDPTTVPHAKVTVQEVMADEALQLAQEKSVKLEIESTKKVGGNLEVEVSVENLAGHKFPSGVGFRRAYLDLRVLDEDGGDLWRSGWISKAGVLLDENGTPLISEFTKDWRELQPDYDVIDSQSQVQIYETRHMNNLDQLTTSFLGLFKEMKDNRLLPKGWTPDGPFAYATMPVKKGGEEIVDPPNPGIDKVTYRIPEAAIAGATSVRVSMKYQAIPPYYLKDRFSVDGPNTERLYYIVNYLSLDIPEIENWSLEMVRSERPLD